MKAGCLSQPTPKQSTASRVTANGRSAQQARYLLCAGDDFVPQSGKDRVFQPFRSDRGRDFAGKIGQLGNKVASACQHVLGWTAALNRHPFGMLQNGLDRLRTFVTERLAAASGVKP